MDKAGIITNITKHQTFIDQATAEGKEVKITKLGSALLEATQKIRKDSAKL
jgi:predicted transcriptional regulator